MTRSRQRLVLAGLLGGAVLVRGLAWVALHPAIAPDQASAIHGSGAYHIYATNLLATGVYGLTPGQPDAALPPLYSLLLAAVYAVAGPSPTNAVGLNIALDVAGLAALWVVARRLFPDDEWVSVLSVGLMSGYPYLVFQTLTMSDTSLFVAQLYALLALLVLLGGGRPRVPLAAIAAAGGAVLGLSLLTRPVLPLLLVLAVPWLARRIGWRAAAVRAAAVAIVGGLVLAPWTIRNAGVFGEPVLVATNGGSNFWQGNNPRTIRYLRAGYDVQWISPGRVRASDPLGPEADRELLARGLAYLRTHPGDLPALLWTKLLVQWSLDITPRRNPSVGDGAAVAERTDPSGALVLTGLGASDPISVYAQPLFDRVGRGVHRLTWGALLLLAAIGLAMRRADWRDLSLLWLAPLTLTITYLVLHPSTRYRAPGDPALMPFAAVALTRIVRRGAGPRGEATPSPRDPRQRPQTAACWIGATAYPLPLPVNLERKWQALSALGLPLHVVGFSTGLRPRRFAGHASFHLLPRPRLAVLRYLVMFTLGPWVLLGVARRYRAPVLISQSPYEGAIAVLVGRALRVFGRRAAVIVESHGDFETALFGYRATPLDGLYRRLMRPAARWALRHATAGRAVSEATRAQLAARAPNLPIAVFPAWIDVETFAAAERDEPPSASHMLVFVGTIVEGKGMHVLIDAFARLEAEFPRLHLVVAGEVGDRSYAAALRERIRDAGLDGRIAFTGRRSTAEVADLLRRARALVLPSFSEGLGLVLLEAMLCGTPVIATRVGGTPDVVVDGETGYLVRAGDPTGLAGRLRQILTDPAVDLIGARARRHARSLVSARRFVDGHRAMLELARPAPLVDRPRTPGALLRHAADIEHERLEQEVEPGERR